MTALVLTMDASQFLAEMEKVKATLQEALNLMDKMSQASQPSESQSQTSRPRTTYDNQTPTLQKNSQPLPSSPRHVLALDSGETSSSSTSLQPTQPD